MATVEAKGGDFNAARRENLAWRQMHLAKRPHPAQRRMYLMQLPAFSLDGSGMGSFMEDLCPVPPEKQRLPCLLERASRRSTAAGKQAGSFWPVAVASIAVSLGCMVPYNAFLVADPGGPLFFNFAVHVVIIIMYLPKAPTFLQKPQLPLYFHAMIVAFWCLFISLKSDAFARLSPAVVVLISNMRMVIGMLVQFLFTRQWYSSAQVLGVIIVTIGIATAGNAMQQAGVAQSRPESTGRLNFSIGVLEVLLSSLSYALYTSVLKVAFTRFGDCTDEQVFVTHVCALLVAFPTQWDKVGPRLVGYISKPDPGLLCVFLAGVLLNVASRWFCTLLAGRAPNLLMTQLVHTMDGFLQLLVAALLRSPPWPPLGFWGGSSVLIMGTLQYLRASGDPSEGMDDEDEEENALAGVDDALLAGTRSDWAVATVEAKQKGCMEAARRENLAWRKAWLAEHAGDQAGDTAP